MMFLDSREFAPKHRAGISDMQWARMQPKPEDAAFYPGDLVRCKESGSLCVVAERSEPDEKNGWPIQYSVASIPGQGKPDRHAWYYDLDLEMVEPSPARKYMKQ